MAKREKPGASKRRGSRAGEVTPAGERRRRVYEAHKAAWERQRNSRAERLAKMKWYIDGRRLTTFLGELAAITDDQRFTAFAALIEEYGLTTDGPAKQCRALIERLWQSHLDIALEAMCIMEREAIAAGKSFSASECAVAIAAEHGVPGPSFETTVERLRKAFGRLDHTWRPHLKLGESQ